MKNIIAKMENGLLDEKHPLYKSLLEQCPTWWKIAKADPELYIDIRKKNKIDIYYRGGRMAGIELKRSGEISVTAHPKYVGYSEADKENPKVYKKRNKNGKWVYDAIYQDCREWMVYRMDELKDNMRHFYTGDHEGQDTSEKLIQGSLIVDNRTLYLDTEFAHRLYEGDNKTVRIDMVKIKDGKLTFVELKRIVDGRLLDRAGNPEILTQMQNYRSFIDKNQEALLDYYKCLYRIKVRLGLPVPAIDSIDSLVLDKEPVLLIAQNYDTMSKGKENRIKEIVKVLATINVVPEFM